MPRLYIYIYISGTKRHCIGDGRLTGPKQKTHKQSTQGIYTALRLGRSRFHKYKSLETDLAATDIVQILPENIVTALVESTVVVCILFYKLWTLMKIQFSIPLLFLILNLVLELFIFNILKKWSSSTTDMTLVNDPKKFDYNSIRDDHK